LAKFLGLCSQTFNLSTQFLHDIRPVFTAAGFLHFRSQSFFLFMHVSFLRLGFSRQLS